MQEEKTNKKSSKLYQNSSSNSHRFKKSLADQQTGDMNIGYYPSHVAVPSQIIGSLSYSFSGFLTWEMAA